MKKIKFLIIALITILSLNKNTINVYSQDHPDCDFMMFSEAEASYFAWLCPERYAWERWYETTTGGGGTIPIEEVVVTAPPKTTFPPDIPPINNPNPPVVPPSTNNGLNSNTLITFDTYDKIPNIKEYLKCFKSSSGLKLTLYVDQPTPNTRDTWSGPVWDPEVGHTYIQLSQNGVTRTMGFYPTGGVNPVTSPKAPSVLNNDSGHNFDVSISINITDSNKITNLLNYISSYTQTYDLNKYNCTDFGIGAFDKSGYILPKTIGSWGAGSGRNPGDLGQDIRNIKDKNVEVNKTGGKTEQNKGGC